jgi:hypothetical protein
MLKAQHPDYELFTRGIHYERGVSCADCHMPYTVEGGVKFTDHRIQNPLNNITAACQTCHRESEATLTRNVYDRQDAVYAVRQRLEEALVNAHFEAAHAWELGATEAQLRERSCNIRRSQWRWDYIAASHGVGFHAPQEALRVLGLGMDYAQQARVQLSHILAGLGHADGPPGWRSRRWGGTRRVPRSRSAGRRAGVRSGGSGPRSPRGRPRAPSSRGTADGGWARSAGRRCSLRRAPRGRRTRSAAGARPLLGATRPAGSALRFRSRRRCRSAGRPPWCRARRCGRRRPWPAAGDSRGPR